MSPAMKDKTFSLEQTGQAWPIVEGVIRKGEKSQLF